MKIELLLPLEVSTVTIGTPLLPLLQIVLWKEKKNSGGLVRDLYGILLGRI